MKKKMLILAGFAVVAMSAAATLYSSQSNTLSSVLIQNVEALARSEDREWAQSHCWAGDTECARISDGEFGPAIYYKE